MTGQEIFKHIINAHNKEREALLRELYDQSFDIEALHTSYHMEAQTHEHAADGSVAAETKTVLDGKSITRTEGGWSYDSTAAQALQELNQIINNRPVEFKFVNENGIIKGLLYHESKHLSVEGPNFLTVVRLLLGEIYNYLHERDTR